MNTKQEIGQHGERLVIQFLQNKGFEIIDQNYRTRAGEIDLIACRSQLLLFIEVKMRQKNYFELSQVITEKKQRKIVITAKDYLVRHDHEDKVCRFDVALVEPSLDTDNTTPAITYIENAFTEQCSSYQ